MANADFAIRSFKGGYDDNFQYLLTCMQSRAQIAVDAALPLGEIRPFIHGAFVAIIITHTHGDHVAYIDEYLKAYPELLVIIHEESSGTVSAINVHPTQDGEQIQVGQLNIEVMHTPGHYPDSVCFWNKKENCLFTGDTMFVGRTGRTIGAKSNISHLYNSIYHKILPLPEQTVIYPGHHYGYTPSVTLKENIGLSNFFQCKTKEEFISVMEEYEKNRRIN